MGVVTKWVTIGLGSCLGIIALGVTAVIVVRADPLWVRAFALIVAFCWFITCSLGLRRSVNWAGKGLPGLNSRAFPVLAFAVAMGVMSMALLGAWSALLVAAILFAATGTILCHQWFRNQQLVFGDEACWQERLKGSVGTFLIPYRRTRALKAKRENDQLGALFWRTWYGFQARLRDSYRLSLTQNRGGGDPFERLPHSPRQSRPRPYFRVSEYRDAAQRRVILGEARVLFEPQQQVASVHFPFWPAFERIPEIHLRGSPNARVKVGKIHPFGMRLDVRLPFPVTNKSRIPVCFRAIERR